MKIALIRQRYVSIGGAERYLAALVQALREQQHEVHVFARAWQEERDAGVHFHRIPVMRAPGFLRALSFAWQAERLVSHAGCDVVFSLERTVRQDVYRAGDGCHREWLLQRSARLPLWRRATIAINPFHQTMLALERRTFSPQRTRLIIANSRRGRDEIVRHFGFPAERIEVIYNGVDGARFSPRPEARSGKDFILLFAGTGFERKGLQFCVDVLARLPAHVKLRVVGKGNAAGYLRRARRLGVAQRVEFVGAGGKIEKAYHEADLLVHPALYEPFANVCLEALASGLPVVTSRMNGAAEVLETGRDGAVVEDPADVEALGAAIRLFLNPERYAAAAAAARRTAEAHPFARHVEQTLAVLKRAMAAKAAAQPRAH